MCGQYGNCSDLVGTSEENGAPKVYYRKLVATILPLDILRLPPTNCEMDVSID